MAPLNVITIVTDTFRPDHLGYNQRDGVRWTPAPLESTAQATGQQEQRSAWISTPNLDRFAARAVSFDHAYCGSFPTIPMRTDLLTGQYTFVSRGWSALPEGAITLPQVLARAGYVTQLIADTGHLFRWGFQNVFLAWDWQRGQEGDRLVVRHAPVEYPCQITKLRRNERGVPLCGQQLRNRELYRFERELSVARACQSACDWLEMVGRKEAPFYLHLDLFDPHEAWLAPEWYTRRYDPQYEGEAVIAPDYAVCTYLSDRELQHARALYAAEATLVDRWLGRVLDKLDDLGLFGSTAVFLLSDHGFYLGERGLTGKHGINPYHTWPFYREVASIVCLARAPELPAGREGSRSTTLVQPVDVLPTVLELTGAQVPPGYALHGESFASVLQEREPRPREREIAVTSGALPTQPDEPAHSGITDGRWLLLEAGPSRSPVLLDQRAQPPITTQGEVAPENLLDRYPAEAERLHAAYLRLLERAGTAPAKLALRRDLATGAGRPATSLLPPPDRPAGRG